MSHAVGLEDALGLTAYSRPAVYTSTHAPNHDRNLRRISRAIESSLIFGHVRAAGHMASVHEYNCHPYSKGRYLFMHNGEVAMFSSIRRKLLIMDMSNKILILHQVIKLIRSLTEFIV